jgi:hypothetical protein
MDLGAATRELAPLKHKKTKGYRLQSKTLLRFLAPPVDPSIDLVDDVELEKDPHLYDHRMFYHVIGLSNLRKIMWPKLEVLNLTVNSEGGIEDSYARGSSVEQESPDGLKETVSKDTLISKPAKDSA